MTPGTARDGDVSAAIESVGRRTPGAVAFACPGRPPLRYGALAAQVDAARRALAAAGLARGHVVAGVVEDRAASFAALAMLPSSSTYAPLPPRLAAQAYADLIERLDARAAVLPGDPGHPFAEAARAAGLAEIALRPDGDAVGAFVVEVRCEGDAIERPGRWPDRWCFVLGTSGTTGRSKLVPQSHAQVVESSAALARRLDIGPADASGHVSPSHLANGLRPALHVPLLAGAEVVVLPEGGVDALMAAIEEGAVSYVTASFTLFREILARAAAGRRFRPRRLRFLRVSSGKLAPAEFRALEDALGVPVVTGLGASEAPIFLHQRLPPHARTAGALGRPVEVEARIADDAGRALPPGATGEIQVRSPRVFERYLDDPAATAEAFVDGWYRTGDLGRVDANGDYHHLGRVREMINRGGEKFSPVAIDDALRSLPGVADAASFALPHPTLGEEVGAVVVPAPGERFDERALVARARAVLDARQVPKRVHAVEAVPRNAAGKVLRAELSRTYAGAFEGSSGREDAQAASPLESVVGALWASAFGLDHVEPGRTFASLAGTPRESAAIAAALSDLLGVDVPAGAVDDASTPASLAASLGRTRR